MKTMTIIIAALTVLLGAVSDAQGPQTSDATDRTDPDYIKARIVQVAKSNHIRPAVALAIAENENSFQADGERRERKIHDSSVGVFQILTQTAASVGFTGTKEQLLDPDTNIHYGIKYLKKCYVKFNREGVNRVACCYNAGLRVKESVCETNLRVIKYQEDVNALYEKWSKTKL